METQSFNKDGKINKYVNLDEILKLNILEILKEEFKIKFHKTVYFGRKGKCQVGKLIGLETNGQFSSLFYIIETDKKRVYIPYGNSLTVI